MMKRLGHFHLRETVAAAAVILLLQPTEFVFALAVDDLTGTTVAPADDPGWASVTMPGRSGIYLGDSWILTARHVGVGPVNFEGGTFDAIPGQQWTISNPSSWGGQSLTTQSDLRIFRIDGDQ